MNHFNFRFTHQDLTEAETELLLTCGWFLAKIPSPLEAQYYLAHTLPVSPKDRERMYKFTKGLVSEAMRRKSRLDCLSEVTFLSVFLYLEIVGKPQVLAKLVDIHFSRCFGASFDGGLDLFWKTRREFLEWMPSLTSEDYLVFKLTILKHAPYEEKLFQSVAEILRKNADSPDTSDAVLD